MDAEKTGGQRDGKPASAPRATTSPEWQTRLLATLEALPDLLFVMDRHGRIVDFHAPNRIGLFLPPERFLGLNAGDTLPELAATVVRQAIAEALATGHHQGGTYALAMPHGERWFELSIAAHGDLQSDDARLVAIARDVTERKQAEDALRESEEKYRLLTEGMQDVVWVLDVEARRFTYVSPSVKNLRGFTAAEVLAQPLEEAWTPEERERLAGRLQGYVADFLAGRITEDVYVPVEFHQPCKDGSAIPSEAICHFVRNRQTGRLELHGVTRDVSVRVRVEGALRESEEKYRLLTEGMQDVAWTLDVESRRFTYVSPSVERLRGYTPAEILARPLEDAWVPEERERLAEFVRQSVADFLAGKIDEDTFITYEMRQPRKDGSTVPSEVVAHLVRNKQTGRLEAHGVTRDVSARERMEKALRESEARFAQTARQSRAFVWEVDADGLYMFVTPVVEDVLGYRPDEVAGHLHFYDLHPEAGRAEFRAAVFDAMDRREKFSDFENPMAAKDGRTMWVSTHAIPLLDKDGALLGYRGVDFDVTARKSAEAALRESEQRLRALNDNLPGGLVYQMDTGVDGRARRLLSVSKGVERMHGVTAEQALSRQNTFYLQIVPEDQARIAELEARAIATLTPFRAEVRCRMPSGEIRWIYVSSAPRRLPNGHLVWDGIEIDVTDRKLAEEALRESEARFAASTKASRSYVWQVDPEGLITYISPMVEEVLGRRPEEIVGQLHFYDLPPAEDREEVKVYGLALMARRETIRDFENRNVARDGRLVWVSSSASPLFAPDGAFRGYQGIDTDITARKQAEEALRESETRFTEATRASRSFVWEVDPAGLYVHVGDMVADVLGYRPEELVGKMHFYDLLPPENREELKRACFDVMARRESPSGFENANVAKDGRLVWLSSSARPLFNPDGTFRGYQGIDTDVTERKQAEEALKTSETRYRGLIDFAVDGILLGAPDGTITDANACMCALAGRTRRELVGRHIAELFAPETLDENPMRFDLVHEGQTVTRVRKIVRPDASEVFVEMHSKQMPDGTYQSILHDITKRKQAEEALRLSEAKYRYLHEAMRDAFATADMRGRLQEFNAAFRKLTGYSAAELRNISYQRLTPRKWHAAEANILKDQVLARGYSDVYEKEYRRKNGTVVPVELRTILIRDAAGRPTGMWASIRDITERKRAETELQRAHAELERRVRERTADLEASREALAQSEEQFRQMAESIQEVFWLVEARTGRALYVSPAFESIWGRPRETLANGLADWLATLHPDDRDGVQRDFARGVRTGTFTPLEYRILRPDGTVRWIRDSAWGIRDRRGRVVRVTGVFRDITEQRRLEAEILQAAEAERQRIGRDLHDSLGQSLTAIGYLADAIREDLARAKRPEAAEIRKLGHLIGQTAAQSHALARGLLLADLKRGGLAAALQELAFRTRELFGVACRYAGPASAPPLDAQTAGQLYRIAQEAAANAAKHGKSKRIEIRLAKNRRGLLLTVRDTGRGLPARKTDGLGLGLDIMRYRAGLIGATLEIDSQPNRGTTVKCRLPLAPPAPKRKK